MIDHTKDQLAEDAAAAKAAGLSYGKYKALQRENLLPSIKKPLPKVASGPLCMICGQPMPTTGCRRKYCGPACADTAVQRYEAEKREERRRKK